MKNSQVRPRGPGLPEVERSGSVNSGPVYRSPDASPGPPVPRTSEGRRDPVYLYGGRKKGAGRRQPGIEEAGLPVRRSKGAGRSTRARSTGEGGPLRAGRLPSAAAPPPRPARGSVNPGAGGGEGGRPVTRRTPPGARGKGAPSRDGRLLPAGLPAPSREGSTKACVEG